ncbi:NAD(P)H-binding protein [Hoyosella sp. YIM 151337]|uniref:NAD(P)H-binding protein n=1 Tax=Hoyosella sp. YIM 151337 TaxID=2992742 RepID=UPI0022357C2B|nr:NAD(P)H-binding protein [Hoyosella sp. YIM 151337]MCW4351848.1 NAD(P)H-binding protein [Hoyosella sp. YIM 151337]
MTILVTGATGGIGRLVVDALIRRGATGIRALTVNPERAQLPPGVEVARGYVGKPETLSAALEGVERMYLAPVPETAAQALEVARTAGVSRVVDLSGGGHWQEMADAVEASGIPWTHLGPGEFMWNFAMWADEIRADGEVRDPHPEAANAPIDEIDIADVAAAALLEDGHVGKYYDMTGPETLTRAQMLSHIAAALGRDIPMVKISREEAIERLRPGMGEFAEWFVDTHGELVGNPQQPSGVVEEILGRPGTTFAAWARRNVAQFR